LRQSGHDVVFVADLMPRASDTDVMSQPESEGRLLLTEDKDFGELVFRQGRPVPGIVLLRIGAGQQQRKVERLQAAIDHFGDILFGRYTVVEETRLRSRPLGQVVGVSPQSQSGRDLDG
jgi:predicted nuclease of predicted toxin-antitoxin system